MTTNKKRSVTITVTHLRAGTTSVPLRMNWTCQVRTPNATL